MEKPVFLSVILCTYNDERYISQAVDSILCQTYPFFELIIVNDGSTDSTRAIVESFKDERIVNINKENTGLIDSLNVGISSAKYDWIARMDGDDIAELDRFKLQIQYIEKGYQLIGGCAQYMDMNGNILYTGKTAGSNSRIKFLLSLGISPLIHPSIIMKKSLVQEVGGYDSNIFCAEDKDMWLMLYHKCRMVNIPQVVLRYRVNPAGISISKQSTQRLNGLISFAKFQNRIDRVSTKEEYDKLKDRIVGHPFYKALLRLYEKEGDRWLSRKIYSLRMIVLYFLIGKTCKIR